MVALHLFFSSLILLSSVVASPIPQGDSENRLHFPSVDPRSDALSLDTALGMAIGTSDPSGAARFVVKYANANRWAPSTLVSNWSLPAGTADPTALPPACPQPGVDPSTYNEDCLSMILYVPPGLATDREVPTLIWLHGGSFIVGSATGPGLDGSKLAIATNSIVAVVQYRLGALGFMAPDGITNLAVKDVVNAMKFLNTVIPSFGGGASRITLAGQSSGANMVRALLAVPSASSLFKSAILQSDPMNFGFLAPPTQQKMQSSFNGHINCTSSNQSCWNSLSLDAILNAQNTLVNDAMTIDPSTSSFEPIRPVRDGSLITSPLDSTAPFPSVNKPVLISTVLNEGGAAIYSQFLQPLASSLLSAVCEASLGPNRTSTILGSGQYPPVRSPANGTIDARYQLETIATDYIWRCSSWTFSRAWVQHGGRAYLGVYTVGASYPGNDAIPYCTQPGVVCHQDDIEIVFGTVSNPNSAQVAFVTEMQKRYKAFLSNGNPNAAGLATWSPATTTDVHALQLGGYGEAPVGACDPGFWGQAVQYDYQVFGI